MTQRFIKLGDGYGDVYELFTLINNMEERVQHLIVFHNNDEKPKSSLAAIFKPTEKGAFQPIYICLEGIPRTENGKPNVRLDEFKHISERIQKKLIEIEVPPSSSYHEEEIYFQHLISILRLNHLLKPL
ncbi:methylthioribose kinase [Halalkalibacillus sediminis]|uniref:Methylthioribose kinase n=1 Tax=Halalkalibacillus sediminis TaxID=2018042 RepID=A0A2I0QW19_9BACI|nr:methylthioribose kinase [Halalkalibacillus sediminis]PKR78514.1 methylthioribose kinase [Halalkalibacillus sediminis]